MSKIFKIRARQVFDSRGNPTIEAEVYSKNQSASAICPSGASTGTYEAFEKRDKNNKRYLGKSVFNAIDVINTKISKNNIKIISESCSFIECKITEIFDGGDHFIYLGLCVDGKINDKEKKPLIYHKGKLL